MGDGEELVKVIVDAADDSARKCICVLYYGTLDSRESLGTGTFLSADDRLLILTCEHVATEFFAARHSKVLYGSGSELPRECVRPLRSNKRADLALLEVIGWEIPEQCRPRACSELQLNLDLRTIHSEYRGFILTGFPAEWVAVPGHKRRTVQAITYFTSPAERHQSSKHRLYLEYQRQPGLLLPDPEGVSGALVIGIRGVNTPNGTPWTFGAPIALQAAWHPSKRYLTCRSLKPLARWLELEGIGQ